MNKFACNNLMLYAVVLQFALIRQNQLEVQSTLGQAVEEICPIPVTSPLYLPHGKDSATMTLASVCILSL